MIATATRLRTGFTVLAATPAVVFAQTTEAAGVPGSALWNMLFGLAIVLGLLFGGAYLLRRLNGGRAFGQSGPLRVVGGVMLGARERIVLIEVEDTWLVVGVVPGQIKTLHTLAKGELPPPKSGEGAFGQWLKQTRARAHGGG